MRVAITMNVVEAHEYDETRDAISHEWQNWLNQQDVETIAVPNLSQKSEYYLENLGADILILSGGNDIVSRYGDIKYAEKNELKLKILATRGSVSGIAGIRDLQGVPPN